MISNMCSVTQPTVQNIFLHDATLLYLALVNKMGKDGMSYANGTLMTLQASTVRNLTGQIYDHVAQISFAIW